MKSRHKIVLHLKGRAASPFAAALFLFGGQGTARSTASPCLRGESLPFPAYRPAGAFSGAERFLRELREYVNAVVGYVAHVAKRHVEAGIAGYG